MNKDVFVAIDFETNGLNPFVDSIVEIGALKFSIGSGEIDSYETLVFAERGPGRTDIHGIDDQMIKGAPRFDEVLPQLVDFLNGTILVAHNAAFDLQFLQCELDQLELHYQPLKAMCTLHLARRIQSLKTRRLADCCIGLGVPVLEGHRALNDAKMASGVFGAIAARVPLQFTEPVGIELPISAYASRRPPQPRPTQSDENSINSWSLGTRIAQLPVSTGDHGPSVTSVISYVDLLRDVLSDRMLTYAEVDSLLDLADSLNLSRSEVRTIHSTFVSELCEDAISDGFITSGERNEIAELASILDVNGWETILDQQAERRRASGKRAVSVWDPNLGLSPVRAQSAETRRIWAREDSISQSDDLATRLFGKSIVITGEFVEFSREEGRSAILRRGGKAPSSVSRKTFAVVVGESAGPSKIDRCFQFGIPMLNYEEFCSLLDSGQLP